MAIPNGFGGRDYPDFGVSNTFISKTRINDLGELSARLGSPSVFDRTGTLIWYDQFIGGLNGWQLSSTTHGNDPLLASSPYLYKPYSAKLTTLDTGAGHSTLQAILPFPYDSPLGVEFAVYPTFPITELEVYGLLYTGTYSYTFDIEYRFDLGRIRLMDENWTYQEIYSSSWGIMLMNIYNLNKCVIDLDKKTYNRVMFNKFDIDASSIGLYESVTSEPPGLLILFRLEATNGQAETLFLDNVVVTIDEPL